ncbi:MAG: FAD:protein FMN transferase, partial [Planctomycetes bacterium]|nr:FAD:protein FMN transferase [Planctomycetota bacterium]
ELSNRAVATSGVQQRFYEIDGKRYSHIIDPRTGRPTEQAPSVTVIAADGVTADAWATVFSVLTIEEGRQLIAAGRAPKLEVMWITGSADEPLVEKTAGFDAYVVE